MGKSSTRFGLVLLLCGCVEDWTIRRAQEAGLDAEQAPADSGDEPDLHARLSELSARYRSSSEANELRSVRRVRSTYATSLPT
jgi:hypothetical protein